MSKRANSLTVNERIILHLDNYNSFRDHYLTPDSVTQQGIANAVNIARNVVPRAITELNQKSLVEERKSRVKSSDRKKKVYFLSRKGLEKAQTLKDKKKVMSTSLFEIPTIQTFVGREEELQDLDGYIQSGKKVIAVTGEPGIGKTTFVGKYASGVVLEKNVFWHDISEGETLHTLLRNLSEFLTRRGNGFLGYMINSSSEALGINKILDGLAGIVSNTLLIFDDVDNADDDTREFLDGLMDRIDDLSNVKVIIIGSKIERFQNHKNSTTMELPGLNKENVRKLIGARKDLVEIFELTRGHPLFLTLLQSGSSSKNLQNYLAEDFVQSLSDAEIKIMQILSIHSKPVPINLILIEKGIDYQDVINLIEKGIIHEVGDQLIDMHDILKNNFYSNITVSKRNKLHLKTAKYLLEQDWVEAQHHLMKAGKHEDCAKSIIENGLKIIRKGLSEEVKEIIDNLQAEKTLWVELLLLRGFINKLKGKWENSLKDYNEALRIFEKDNLSDRQADTRAKIGRVLLEMGDFDKAIKEFNKALLLLTTEDCSVGARIYDEFGTIHIRRRQYEKARKAIEKALKISKKISDKDMIVRVNNTYGRYHLSKENWAEAKKHFEIFYKGIKGTDDDMEVMAINNLAIVNYKTGETDKALKLWEEAAGKAEVLKLLSVMITFSNLGFMFYKLGNWETSVSYCNKAIELSEPIGKHITTSAAKSILGHMALHRDQEDWLEYYEDALRMREKWGDKKGQASSHNDLAFGYIHRNDLKFASSHAEKANSISEKIEYNEEMVRSYLNLANIAALRNKMKESKEHLRITMSLLKQGEYDVLKGIALRYIGMISALEKEFFIAARYLKDSIEILERTQDPLELGYSLYEYGSIVDSTDIDDPTEYWQRSKKIFKSLNIDETPPLSKNWSN